MQGVVAAVAEEVVAADAGAAGEQVVVARVRPEEALVQAGAPVRAQVPDRAAAPVPVAAVVRVPARSRAAATARRRSVRQVGATVPHNVPVAADQASAMALAAPQGECVLVTEAGRPLEHCLPRVPTSVAVPTLEGGLEEVAI